MQIGETSRIRLLDMAVSKSDAHPAPSFVCLAIPPRVCVAVLLFFVMLGLQLVRTRLIGTSRGVPCSREGFAQVDTDTTAPSAVARVQFAITPTSEVRLNVLLPVLLLLCPPSIGCFNMLRFILPGVSIDE